MKQRASAIIIIKGKILLIKRIKPGEEYYTFPGGSVEAGESAKQAMWREVKEELSIDANVGELLFRITNSDHCNNFFLVNCFVGNPEIGGPEKERSSNDNQYHIEFIDLKKLGQIENLYPHEAREKLATLLLKSI